MIQKVSRVLFYSLFVIYPFGLLLRVKLTTNVYILPQDILVFLLFVIAILDRIKKKDYKIKDKFILFQLAFLLVGATSLITNTLINRDVNIFISSLYLLRYTSYLNLVNIRSLIGKVSTKSLIFFSGFLLLAFGYLQYFFYYDLKYLYYFGWDNHLYRMVGTFLDPNYTGVFYSILFFVLLSPVLYLGIRRSYSFLVYSFFVVIAVYLTYSRTALVSLMLGITSISILTKKLKFLLFGVIVFFILLIAISDVSIEGLNPFRTASSIERVLSVKEATHIFFKNPILGVGFNAYRYAMVRYGLRNPLGAAMSNADAGTDNSVLFVLATTGIAGFCFFALSYFFLLKKLFNERNTLGIIPFCMLISFIAGSLFLNVLFYTPLLMFVFTVLSVRNQFFEKVKR